MHYGFIRMQSSSTFNTFMFSGCFFNKNRAVVSSGTVRRAAEKSAPLCARWEKQDGRLCQGRCLQRRMLLWHRGAKITRRPQWTPSMAKRASEAAEEVIATRTLRDPNLQILTKSLMHERWLRPKTVCRKKKKNKEKDDIDDGRVLLWIRGKIFYIESCKVLNLRGRRCIKYSDIFEVILSRYSKMFIHHNHFGNNTMNRRIMTNETAHTVTEQSRRLLINSTFFFFPFLWCQIKPDQSNGWFTFTDDN